MDYMGDSDSSRRAWMVNFVAKLSAPGGTGVYQVTGADVSAISAAVADFVAKLAVCESPDRNKSDTVAKNDSRAAAQGICRQYARLIKWNAGIGDTAKTQAGIKPPVFGGESRACPVGGPSLEIVAATNGAQTLNYGDPLDPTARRKPVGADGIVLFVAIAETAATDINQAKFYRKYTTSPMPVFFEGADRGKIATYWARWIGQRGDMSTPSNPVSMAIAA